MNKSVLREILNHRLCVVRPAPPAPRPRAPGPGPGAAAERRARAQVHPNIVQFREIFLTPVHLAIVMEFAAGGDMFEYVIKHKLPAHGQGLQENAARTFFQQLIVALEFCHELGIANRCACRPSLRWAAAAALLLAEVGPRPAVVGARRAPSGRARRRRDIKLENTLLDAARPQPNVKICDFGYSKNEFVDSRPKTVSGTPDYIAPEVLMADQYDGKRADLWSCGVMLYVMLTGAPRPGAPRADAACAPGGCRAARRSSGARAATPLAAPCRRGPSPGVAGAGCAAGPARRPDAGARADARRAQACCPLRSAATTAATTWCGCSRCSRASWPPTSSSRCTSAPTASTCSRACSRPTRASASASRRSCDTPGARPGLRALLAKAPPPRRRASTARGAGGLCGVPSMLREASRRRPPPRRPWGGIHA